MSDILQNLIDERDAIRAQESDLTEQIKEERRRIAEIAKDAKDANFETRYRELQEKHERLRGAFVVFSKLNGDTYRQAGEMLGIKPERAAQLMKRRARQVRNPMEDII